MGADRPLKRAPRLLKLAEVKGRDAEAGVSRSRVRVAGQHGAKSRRRRLVALLGGIGLAQAEQGGRVVAVGLQRSPVFPDGRVDLSGRLVGRAEFKACQARPGLDRDGLLQFAPGLVQLSTAPSPHPPLDQDVGQRSLGGRMLGVHPQRSPVFFFRACGVAEPVGQGAEPVVGFGVGRVFFESAAILGFGRTVQRTGLEPLGCGHEVVFFFGTAPHHGTNDDPAHESACVSEHVHGRYSAPSSTGCQSPRLPCHTESARIHSTAMSQAPASPSPPHPSQAAAAQGVLFTRNYVLLCAGAFLFSGSMFVLFAVLPLFVVEELHGAESQVGLIMGAFALAAVLTRPLSGQLVSIWSRKSGLSLGTFIYFLAPALYTLVGSVPVMLGLRFFHGIGIAIYTTASSVFVADLSPPARRGEAMGYYGMALNLSMTVGPALGAYLVGRIGFINLFWLSAGLALVSFLLTLLLREPQRPAPPLHAPTARPPLFSRSALFPGLIAVCMTMTFGVVVSFLPLFVQAHQLGNPGLFFTVYSIAVVVSRPFAGRLSDRFGRPAVIIPGMLLLAAAMTILAFSTSQFGMLSAAVLQGFGFGGVQPSLMAQVVDRSTDHDRGPALATLMGAFDVGVGLSSIGLGLVLEATSFSVTFLCAAGIGLCGAGASAWDALRPKTAASTPSVAPEAD